jgi:hypothetical protein
MWCACIAAACEMHQLCLTCLARGTLLHPLLYSICHAGSPRKQKQHSCSAGQDFAHFFSLKESIWHAGSLG